MVLLCNDTPLLENKLTFFYTRTRAHTHTRTHTPRFWAMPAFLLKRQILMNLPSDNLEVEVANSIDFMVERVCLMSLDFQQLETEQTHAHAVSS